MDRKSNDPCFPLTSSAGIPHQAVVPGTFAASDFPAFLFASIRSNQMVADVPANDKPQTLIQCQGGPGTTCKAAIPQVNDLPAPYSGYFSQDFAFYFSFRAGLFAPRGPPTQVRQHRRPFHACDQHLQPVETWHKN